MRRCFGGLPAQDLTESLRSDWESLNKEDIGSNTKQKFEKGTGVRMENSKSEI